MKNVTSESKAQMHRPEESIAYRERERDFRESDSLSAIVPDEPVPHWNFHCTRSGQQLANRFAVCVFDRQANPLNGRKRCVITRNARRYYGHLNNGS